MQNTITILNQEVMIFLSKKQNDSKSLDENLGIFFCLLILKPLKFKSNTYALIRIRLATIKSIYKARNIITTIPQYLNSDLIFPSASSKLACSPYKTPNLAFVAYLNNNKLG